MTKAICKRPGCENPPRPQRDLTRRPPLYCSDACKTAASRQRRAAALDQIVTSGTAARLAPTDRIGRE